MKKRILFLLTTACLVLSLAACGGNNAAQDTPAASDTPNQTTAPTTTPTTAPDSDLPSLEDFFNSEEMQSLVAMAQEQYVDQGISAKIYAEGDELRYEFRMDDVVTAEEERPALAEALKTSTEAAASTYQDTATQAKDSVSNDVVIVVVAFYDGAGNELYSQSFSSADAE